MGTTNQHRNLSTTLKPATVFKAIGLFFIIFASAITLFISCPSKAQYFIIYALIGVGIALLLAKSAEKAKADFKIWNMSVGLAGGVALPFLLFFVNPISNFKHDDCDLKLSATSVTVFVHGKKGKQDMILRQQGYVIMDVEGERKKASINENGQAFFQNLRFGDSVRINIDFSEPYKAIYPDSIYSILLNSKIYLPVTLESIDKVEGRVLYNEAPLEGVIVEINDLTDTTDGNGRFNITIPEIQQRKEYKVWFMKAGFKSKSASAFPQTGPLEIVMEK